MSVAIQSDDSESLRDEVEAEYNREDLDVPDESQTPPLSYSFYSSEFCC